MQIVSFIKDSTVECSPFKWGLTLFSAGCNLHCKMCEGYNYEKVTDKNNVIGSALEIIKNNVTPLHDSVVFIGGEPTIWGDELESALQFCHDIGLKTKIFSNGFNHLLIERLNEKGLCDAWSIDFKGLHNIQQEFGVPAQEYLPHVEYSILDIAGRGLPLEIRTTFYSGNENWREEIRQYVAHNFQRKYPHIKYIEQEDVRDII
jgi:pyruvate-formate lyase-activating enzyme